MRAIVSGVVVAVGACGAALAGAFEPTPCGDLMCHPPGKVTVRTAHGDVEVDRTGVPYLENGAIVLLPGDEFDVDLEFVAGEAQARVTLSATGEGTGRRGIHLKMEQMSGKVDTLLTLQNNSGEPIKYSATMRVENGRMLPTSSCPVLSGLSAFEHWPHPILRLTLANFRKLEGENVSMVCD